MFGPRPIVVGFQTKLAKWNGNHLPPDKWIASQFTPYENPTVAEDKLATWNIIFEGANKHIVNLKRVTC